MEDNKKAGLVKKIRDYRQDYLDLADYSKMSYQEYLWKQIHLGISNLHVACENEDFHKERLRHLKTLMLQLQLLGDDINQGEINYEELIFGERDPGEKIYKYKVKCFLVKNMDVKDKLMFGLCFSKKDLDNFTGDQILDKLKECNKDRPIFQLIKYISRGYNFHQFEITNLKLDFIEALKSVTDNSFYMNSPFKLVENDHCVLYRKDS